MRQGCHGSPAGRGAGVAKGAQRGRLLPRSAPFAARSLRTQRRTLQRQRSFGAERARAPVRQCEQPQMRQKGKGEYEQGADGLAGPRALETPPPASEEAAAALRRARPEEGEEAVRTAKAARQGMGAAAVAAARFCGDVPDGGRARPDLRTRSEAKASTSRGASGPVGARADLPAWQAASTEGARRPAGRTSNPRPARDGVQEEPL